MPVMLESLVQRIKYTLLFLVMVFVWLLLFMVQSEYFFPPFEGLMSLLMPSKSLYSGPASASMMDRMAFMNSMLESSHRISRIAFAVMITAFIVFTIHLTVVYQQKQRRARENRLLQLKNEEIARRTEFIRYISATIGHEFKNNLARIKRRLDLLPGLPDDIRTRIDGNMKNLFADITIFKQISDEREGELAGFGEVHLERMLSDIAEQFRDMVDAEFESSITPPVIYASETLLKTVYENLFDNAVKYKKPDQDRARVRGTFNIDRDGTRPYVTISFRDEGIGMDEQQAEQCFYKGVASEAGWGEGLYFAKYVIGLHAGKIRVGKEHTSPGAGTEIIINLPFVEETLHV